MHRLVIILSIVLVFFLTGGFLHTSLQSRSPRPQLTLTVTDFNNRTATVKTATLQITNVGIRAVDIFPMYSVEDSTEDVIPFRADASGLGGIIMPGGVLSVRIFLHDIDGTTARVGVWYSAVRPRWRELISSWLSKIGLDTRQRKTVEYSGWFRAESNPIKEDVI